MILVTGGAGFIGSHTCIALARAGLGFVLLDNFSNSDRTVLQRLEKIVGRSIRIYEGDIRNRTLLRSNFEYRNVEPYFEDRTPVLLQSGRLPRKRASWREPTGNSQQPDAVCHPSLAITWPLSNAPQLSAKDSAGQSLQTAEVFE